MKHSPGPWTLEMDDDEEGAQVLDADGQYISVVDDYGANARVFTLVEDARLIAAAPRMLKELKRLAASLRHGMTSQADNLDAFIEEIEGK